MGMNESGPPLFRDTITRKERGRFAAVNGGSSRRYATVGLWNDASRGMNFTATGLTSLCNSGSSPVKAGQGLSLTRTGARGRGVGRFSSRGRKRWRESPFIASSRGVKFVPVILFAAVTAFAQTNLPPEESNITRENMAVLQHAEELRAICIKNRRMICGKIIKVLPDGIVVDSGYTNLMRAPLDRSWLIPGSANAGRATNFVEKSQPDSVCFGQVFLTDVPKPPTNMQLNVFDFVILEGFPMGNYPYTSVGSVTHTVRRFSTKVTTAVRWTYGQEVDKQEKAAATPQK